MSAQQITAWDGTVLDVEHSTPGATTVQRLGHTMEALVTQDGRVLIPADMDPTCGWWVEATTGEIANVHAAADFISRSWPTGAAAMSYAGIDITADGAMYRWQVWGSSGQLLDLVLTPAALGCTASMLKAEVLRAGWDIRHGTADPLRRVPTHRTWSNTEAGEHLPPTKPVRWLMPATSTTPRTWPLTGERHSAAQAACRRMGKAALRTVCDLTTTEPRSPYRPRVEAALVGVVELHLARPALGTSHEQVCSCVTGEPVEHTSGHMACCACHEPAMLQRAAERKLTHVTGWAASTINQEIHHG